MTKDHTVSQDPSGLGQEGLSPSVARSDARDAKSSVEGSEQRRATPTPAGYECLQRILAFMRDGDVDAHDSLRNDVERLYALMVRWRVIAQRWTPGGSEYMDPDYCADFIQRRSEESHRNRLDLHRVVREKADLLAVLREIAAGDFNCSPHQRFMAAQSCAEAAIAKATSDPTPLSAELGATGNDQGREEPK